MSVWARVGIAVVLLAGAGLFVYALTLEPAPESPPEPAPAKGEGPVREWPPAEPGILDDPASCKGCHPGIWAEWEQDRHRMSWSGELYTRLSKDHTDASCWACHAPRPILDTGLSSPAETRADYRDTGINCLTCHRQGNHVVGGMEDPKDTPEVKAACGPKHDPRFPADRPDMQDEVIAFCGVCHNLHGTHLEFMGSRYYREGMTCLSCHMEERVEAPVAKGGEPRLRRVHRFPGAHSEGMLKRAMAIEASVADGRVVARVVNRGAGHRIPTDARHRAIFLRAAFLDAYGQPVPVPDPATGEPDREVTLDLIRLFYRPEHKDPTQVDPEGTLGKDNWRGSSIAVPPSARGGKVRLRLYYQYYVYDPLEKAVLVEEKELDLG